jgi:hypothetical protein
VIGRAFARVLSGLGLTGDPLLALQVLDMLLGATAVGGLWLLLRHAGCSALAAAAGCGTVAFSYGFWRNAVDAEVYALSAVALVGCLAAAWAATQRPSARAFAVLGLVNGAAVLAHVTNVLFAAAAGVAVVLVARRLGEAAQSPVRWGAAYAGAVAAVVVPVYGLAAAVHGLGSPPEFWRWFTERSGRTGDVGTVGLGHLARAAFGSARALVGGHFALSLEPIRDFATGRFAGKTFSEELFFLEGFPRGLAVALLGVGALAGALVVGLGAQWLRRAAVDPPRRALALLAAAWLVPFALLFLWWDPLNIELWPAVWVPAAVLVALAADTLRGDRARAALALGAAASLFAVNLAGSLLPQRDEERDLWRAKAEWYRAHARSDDLLVSNGYVWSAYLRYHVDAEVVDIEDLFREAKTERAALDRLRRRVGLAPARVLVSGEAFHAFAERRISCLDAPRTCEIAAVTARELRAECRLLAVAHDPLERVWTCPRTA